MPELLTWSKDDPNRAIVGPQYPADLGPVVKWLDDLGEQRLAYLHTFGLRDPEGHIVEGTEVRFYVPDFMLTAGLQPDPTAMRLVESRMGWESVRKYGQLPS